jgi:hypothetical protein
MGWIHDGFISEFVEDIVTQLQFTHDLPPEH